MATDTEMIVIPALDILDDYTERDIQATNEINAKIEKINSALTKEEKLAALKEASGLIFARPNFGKSSPDYRELTNAKRAQINAAIAMLEGRIGGRMRRRGRKTLRKGSKKGGKKMKSRRRIRGGRHISGPGSLQADPFATASGQLYLIPAFAKQHFDDGWSQAAVGGGKRRKNMKSRRRMMGGRHLWQEAQGMFAPNKAITDGGVINITDELRGQGGVLPFNNYTHAKKGF